MATVGGAIPTRLVERAERCAWTLLRGWPATGERGREDLVQDALLEAWGFWPRLRSRDRFPAVVGTIARRLRRRASRARGVACLPLEAADEVCEPEGGMAGSLRVLGQWVDRAWLCERLDEALAGLAEIDRSLLLGYYGGASCRELADRLGLSPNAVKTRLCRCRHELQHRLERVVRTTVVRSDPSSDGATASE